MISGLIWVSLVVCIVVSANAHPSSNEMPFVGLAVLPEPNLHLTGRNQADYEVGKLNSLDNPQVEHRFTIRNEAEAPLAITNLETNCHCTTAIVEKIADHEPTPAETFVYYLQPGQEMVIKVNVQLARQLSGPMSHGVAIYVHGHENPIVRLNITGDMQLGLMVTPSELDFGQMKQGEIQSQTITIVCDKRLLSYEALPRIEGEFAAALGSKNGSILKIVPKPETASANSVKLNSAMSVKTYVVTVQPKQTGKLTGRLFFVPTSSAEYRGTIPYDRAANVFREMQVEMRGDVTRQ